MKEYNYRCADCNESRHKKHVEMIEHEDTSLGSFPICSDKDCSIRAIRSIRDNSGGSEHKITTELK